MLYSDRSQNTFMKVIEVETGAEQNTDKQSRRHVKYDILTHFLKGRHRSPTCIQAAAIPDMGPSPSIAARRRLDPPVRRSERRSTCGYHNARRKFTEFLGYV